MNNTANRLDGSFNFTSQEFKQNPFPTLHKMRELGPVIRTTFPFFGNVWMATTYDAVNELLRNHHQFVQNPAAAGNRWLEKVFRWMPRSLRPLTTHMLISDEPDHRRLRGLVDQAFQTRHVEALRPRLELLAGEMLDQFAAQAKRSRGGVDLISHFARPFPLAVICELLGLPPEDRPKFTQWASGFGRASTLAGIPYGLWSVSRIMRYLRDEIHRQRTRPRDGMLAALIQAEEAGDRLTEDELVAMVFLLLAAGHETTLYQIAGSTLALLDHPEQRRLLTTDWDLATSAVNELFRYVSFGQMAKPRYAREDTEFQGRSIQRGQILFACLASANADPSRFENPEQLDLRRGSNRHVALGAGIHYCLGAALARVETEIALRQIFTRFPELDLAVARSNIRYSRRPGTRGLVELPVKW
jgi:cytochrome P450